MDLTLYRRSRNRNVEKGLRTRRGAYQPESSRRSSAAGAETLFYFITAHVAQDFIRLRLLGHSPNPVRSSS